MSIESLRALAETLHEVDCQPGARVLAEWSPGHVDADQRRAKAVFRGLQSRGLALWPVGDSDVLSDDVLADAL